MSRLCGVCHNEDIKMKESPFGKNFFIENQDLPSGTLYFELKSPYDNWGAETKRKPLRNFKCKITFYAFPVF